METRKNKLQALIGAIKNLYTIIQSKLRLLTCWQQAVGKTDCVEDGGCDCEKENISCFDKKLNNMTGESNAGKEVRRFIDGFMSVFKSNSENSLNEYLKNNNISNSIDSILFYDNKNERAYLHFDNEFFYLIYLQNGKYNIALKGLKSEFKYEIVNSFSRFYLSIKGVKSLIPISDKLFFGNTKNLIEESINKVK